MIDHVATGCHELLLDDVDLLALEDIFLKQQQQSQSQVIHETLKQEFQALQQGISSELVEHRQTLLQQFKKSMHSTEVNLFKEIKATGKHVTQSIRDEIHALNEGLMNFIDQKSTEIQASTNEAIETQLTGEMTAQLERQKTLTWIMCHNY